MKKRILFLVLSVAAAGVIFFFSAQPGAESAEESSSIAGFFQKVFYPSWESLPEDIFELRMSGLNTVIRKVGHFTVFLVLAMALGGFYSTFRISTMKQFLFTFVTGSLYGVFDEIHQGFVPNRDMAVFDMLVDAAGVLFGCFTVFFVILFIHEKRNKKGLTASAD